MRTNRRSGRRLVGWGAFLALLLAAGPLASPLPARAPVAAQPGEATAPQATALIRSLETVATDRGAKVVVGISRPVRWTSQLNAEGDLLMRLEDALPEAGLADLVPDEGLVASVRLLPERQGERAATILRLDTREKTAYSVSLVGERLSIELWRLRKATPARGPSGQPPAPRSPAQPAPSSSSAPSIREAEYRIVAGDLLGVNVVGVEELNQSTRVERDGRIAMPLLGRFPISGLTVEEAERAIASRLEQAKLLNKPEVLVSVEEYASYGISVQGAVSRPGVHPMLGKMTLLDALGLAGGVLAGGGGQQIYVVRRQPESEELRIEIDAARLLDAGDLTQNLTLMPGDVVMVPRARELRVYVTGAVRQPGPVEFSSSAGITALQAITAAGGPTERAKLGDVVVLRQLDDGTQERITVNLKKIRKGRENDLPLQNNDTIVVREWFL